MLATQFDTYSKQFGERALSQGITPDAQLQTVRSLEKLVQVPDNAGAKMDQLDRTMLAFDFMYHAANPSTIDQGERDTCSVSTIEERMFTKHPAQVADMVQQVLLTGQWKAADGKIINIDSGSLVPGTEESAHPPSDGQRSLVSQIFQVTALNDIAQRGELGGYIGQSVLYCESDGKSFVKLDKGKQTGNFIGLADNAMQAELTRLTGETSPAVMINVERDKGTFKNVIHFDSPEQFQAELQKMKAENNLPAILGVYSNLPPFDDPSGGGHVVSITDIKKDADGTYKVYLDNQWGSVGPGSDAWYPLEEIFNATKRNTH